MWVLGVDLSPLQEQDQFYLLSHLTNLENILLSGLIKVILYSSHF